MLELGTFEEARAKVLANAQRLLLAVRRSVSEPIDSIDAGMSLLSSVRKQAHEHLHQIQHEQMIVCAAEWMVNHDVGSSAISWQWNPRHSNDHANPSLIGMENDEVRVSAEVSAMEEPVGVIDAQMRRTLTRLAAMPGRRFYFVRSASMKRRAVTKVLKAGWDIAVVQIALQPAAATVAPPPTSLTAGIGR